jgi:hypothetical protein
VFEHITRARCAELGTALTAAGLPWKDNGHQAAPARLTYTATDLRGRQWSIRPVAGAEFTPWQPSSLWRALCSASRDRSTVMSAWTLTDHIREFPA